MKKIVLCTGGFDPLHSGHLEYLRAAKKLGKILIVGINSDEWLVKKKGKNFLSWEERSNIVSNLRMVDLVLSFDDSDGSACDAIKKIHRSYPSHTIVFANGGDRTEKNIPEMDLLEEIPNLEFEFGVGGNDKINSSSWLLDEWRNPKTTRPWGYYRVLYEQPGIKVKELSVEPGQSLTMQKHQYRSEYWIVGSGEGKVLTDTGTAIGLLKHSEYKVLSNQWHQLSNPTSQPLKVIEIQYGQKCDESDITRK